MHNVNISSYDNIIFDCDGVIIDSNNIKRNNIEAAARRYAGEKQTKEFVDYFVSNNGVPREEKVERFYADRNIQKKILDAYGKLNRQSLFDAPYTMGFKDLLNHLVDAKKKLFVVSGGSEEELKELFCRRSLTELFTAIKGGEKRKKENIRELGLDGATVFIGDSKEDYMAAAEFNYDFIFLSRYTCQEDWEKYYAGRKGVVVIPTLSQITSSDQVG